MLFTKKMVVIMNLLEQELKQLVIDVLHLEDIGVEDIDANLPLFGEGLGLDSIDALELGVALQKRFGLTLTANSEETRRHFRSIHSLALMINAQRASST